MTDVKWEYINSGSYEGWTLVGAVGPGGPNYSTAVLAFRYLRTPADPKHARRFAVGELYVYAGAGWESFSEMSFDTLEEAQAYAVAAYRLNGGKNA